MVKELKEIKDSLIALKKHYTLNDPFEVMTKIEFEDVEEKISDIIKDPNNVEENEWNSFKEEAKTVIEGSIYIHRQQGNENIVNEYKGNLRKLMSIDFKELGGKKLSKNKQNLTVKDVLIDIKDSVMHYLEEATEDRYPEAFDQRSEVLYSLGEVIDVIKGEKGINSLKGNLSWLSECLHTAMRHRISEGRGLNTKGLENLPNAYAKIVSLSNLDIKDLDQKVSFSQDNTIKLEPMKAQRQKGQGLEL